MRDLKYIKDLIKEVVEEVVTGNEDQPELVVHTQEDEEKAKFEEDPVNYILQKYKTLKETLEMLMTKHFKDYVTGIYIVAPKPTTFKIVLHNGQSFILTYTGKTYTCRAAGKTYYLLTIGEKERAIISIARLLETGSPITTKGPEQEEESKPAEPTPAKPKSTGAPKPQEAPEEKPAETEEEEKTES